MSKLFGGLFYTESWGAPILSGITLVCRFKPYYTRTTIVSRIQVLSRSGSQEQQHHFIDLLDLNVEGSDGMSSSVDGLVRGNEKNCVKLRGLPWAAKPEDVISFFGDLGSEIAPKGIHMVLSPMVSKCISFIYLA